MTYLLYTSHTGNAQTLMRHGAQQLLQKSRVRQYFSAGSCAHCRTYVLQTPEGEIVNLRVANKGCSAL